MTVTGLWHRCSSLLLPIMSRLVFGNINGLVDNIGNDVLVDLPGSYIYFSTNEKLIFFDIVMENELLALLVKLGDGPPLDATIKALKTFYVTCLEMHSWIMLML